MKIRNAALIVMGVHIVGNVCYAMGKGQIIGILSQEDQDMCDIIMDLSQGKSIQGRMTAWFANVVRAINIKKMERGEL